MPFLFDWATLGSPTGSSTIVDGVHSTTLTSTAFSTSNANNPGYFTNFGGVLFSQNVPNGQYSGVQVGFGDAVENVRFEILDLDASRGGWDDQVSIFGVDENGNRVYPTFSNLESYHAQTGPGTVEANGNSSTGVDGPGARDSITVTFNQPIVGMVIAISGGSSGLSTGAVGIGDISGDIVCFAAGTLIRTEHGEVPVEDLQVGDLVQTLDHGLQPIRWIGSRTVAARGAFAPIVIAPGVLNNTRVLVVSPQHRMLLSGWQAELLTGEAEVLVAAKHMVDDARITRREGGEITYYHFLFDSHEIVFAEGAACESFHPGRVGIDGMDQAQRDEIFALFPELEQDMNNFGPLARMGLKAGEGTLLADMRRKPD